MPTKPLEPGDPLRLGRFELLGRLGEGGQGVVYLGRGAGPGEERVAVKVLRSSVDAHVLERLARELDAIHQVQPFVTAGVIEASADGDRRYVVSEFIDGPSLQERVDTRGPLSEGELRRLAVGTATALTAIHGAGVVHRDFKPANVLLGPDGPRVVDFGIARLTDAATITSGVIGTPSYIAPEQLSGARPTSAVDIFAWAVTMTFAGTGRSAFGADNVSAVMQRILHEEPDVSELPPSLRPVIRQCLEKDPLRRPSARDLLLRLVDPSVSPQRTEANVPVQAEPTFIGYEPTELSQPGTMPRTTQPAWSRRGPVLAAAAGAAVVAAVIVAVVLLLTRSSPPHTAAGTGHDTTSPSTTPTATQAAQTAGPTIPTAFAGKWSGTATMTAIGSSGGGLTSSIEFTLKTGATTASEVNQSCVNTLTLTSKTATVLTFDEPQTPQCQGGTVTFTRHGANLAYHWLDAAGLAQNDGTLHKTG